MATKMRQSLTEFERAFADEVHVDRARRESLRRKAVLRSQQRELDREHAKGTVRFAVLVLALIATVVATTIGMFQLLLLVMG